VSFGAPAFTYIMLVLLAASGRSRGRGLSFAVSQWGGF